MGTDKVSVPWRWRLACSLTYLALTFAATGRRVSVLALAAWWLAGLGLACWTASASPRRPRRKTLTESAAGGSLQPMPNPYRQSMPPPPRRWSVLVTVEGLGVDDKESLFDSICEAVAPLQTRFQVDVSGQPYDDLGITGAHNRRPRRLQACVEAWPEAEEGQYDPRCCRFPKACSPRPIGVADVPNPWRPPAIDQALFAPIIYPPVKCPDCGTWWRAATHRCIDMPADPTRFVPEREFVSADHLDEPDA